MSAQKGRPVSIKFKKFNGRELEAKEAVARFHCWGFRKSKDNKWARKKDERDPIIQETVAVCELEDGSIKLVIPERVKFLDKG